MSEDDVRLWIPGYHSRKAVRSLVATSLILLVALGSLSQPLPGVLDANASPEQSNSDAAFTILSDDQPNQARAERVPELELPRTVISSLDSLIGAGGVIQTSPDNITVYNSAIAIRLLGGASPYDQLLSQDRDSKLFWRVEALSDSIWLPLLPLSNTFTLLGTEASGTRVVRTMQVSTSSYSGEFNIHYRATTAGPLKWDLEFAPEVSGSYRLVYWWQNTRGVFGLVESSKEFKSSLDLADYTFSWRDIPPNFSTAPRLDSGMFTLAVDLGTLTAGSRLTIDPSIIANNVAAGATAYGFQRKVFYEPKGGYYWVFYYDGYCMVYRTSLEGNSWSAAQSLPSGLNECSQGIPSEIYLKHIYYSGQRVVIATGETKTLTSPSPFSGSASVFYREGTISGSTITWGALQTAATVSRTCNNGNPGSSCTMTIGIRFVHVVASSNGQLAFSYNWYSNGPGSGVCSPTTESAVVLRYLTGNLTASCASGDTNRERSVVLASNSQGQVRVVYQFPAGSNTELRARWFDGTSSGSTETIEASIELGDELSAVSDADYGSHVVYKMADGTLKYAYKSVSGGSWSLTSNIFSGSAGYPTITLDYSNNNLYASGIQGPSTVMKRKTLTGAWSDGAAVFPVTFRTSPTNLGSNFQSASATNSSRLLLVWVEGTGPYTAMFASVPIQTVWSPFGLSADPWDRNGLVPNGQHTSNLDESVSPNSGMLTVRQTDLRVPGRRLGVEIGRVYAEPLSFLAGSPYSYESYPWAPIGNGWQFSFPWMTSGSAPLLLHLWNGQAYRIPASFWSGSTASFENHQGDHFRLVRNLDGTIDLYGPPGTNFRFDSIKRLTTVKDKTGNNTISFSYDGSNRISSITDTVGRIFLFCYSGSLLRSINQTSGTCASGAGSIRGVVYAYSGQTLISVTDPGNRVTSFQYSAVSDISVRNWLISRITYPTNAYANFTYSPVTMGSQSTTYRVKMHIVSMTSGSTLRQYEYTYSQGSGGDEVTSSTVKMYNGTQLASFRDYAFSFSVVAWNVSDASHNFLRGTRQYFSAHGDVITETMIVTDGQGGFGSYTNVYSYDHWGNRIYGRLAISPAAGWHHDKFSYFYNNRGSQGFYVFQEEFSDGITDGWTKDFVMPSKTPDACCPVRINREKMDVVSGWLHFDVDGYPVGFYFYGPIVPLAGKYKLWNMTFNWKAHSGTSASSVTNLDFQLLMSNGTRVFMSQLAQGGATDVQGLYSQNLNLTVNDATSHGNLWVRPVWHIEDGWDFDWGQTGDIDYVRITTASGFSNSFIASGAPASDVHTTVGGIAEFRNGTGTQPIETYYSYYSWGGPKEQRQRFDSQTGLQWLTSTSTQDYYGNRKSFVNARGNATYYTYSPAYQQAYLTNTTQIVTPSVNVTTSYTYDFTTGSMLATIDPMGNKTDYSYDAVQRMTLLKHPPVGGVRWNTTMIFQDAENSFGVRNEKGNYTEFYIDGIGRTTEVEKYYGDPSSQVLSTEHFAYDWQNNINKRTAPDGNVTTYAYDALGRITRTTNPGGTYRTVSYDDVNFSETYLDERQNKTIRFYDALQRLTSVREYYSSSSHYTTSYFYDEVGSLVKVVGSNPQILAFTSTDDAYIRSDQPNSNFGSATTLQVDNSPVKNFLLKFNVSGVGASQVTKARLRLYQVDSSSKGGDFYKTTTSSWTEGTVTWNNAPATTGSAIATLGTVAANTWYEVDITSAVTGDGIVSLRVTSTSSDGADYTSKEGTVWFKPQLLVTLSTGQTTTYSYDSLNRLILTKHPDGFNETRTYDQVGNLVAKKDPNGNTVNYTYDTLNRLTNSTYPDGTKAYFAYNKRNNLIGMSNQNSTATFTYDARNRLSSEIWTIDGASYTVNYGYDAVGNLASITYPDGVNVSYSNDPINRFTGLKKAGISLANITYTSTSRISSISYGNGVQTTDSYDPRTRPSRIKVALGATVLLDLNYTYDSVGNILNINAETYSFDFLNRLTYSSGPWGTLQYGYDAFGNRQWFKQGATNTTYVYGAYNRLLAAGSTSYTYDNNGNLKTSTTGSTTRVYNYDFENRLNKVTQGASTLGAYAYDPTGWRIKKVESGVTTVYVNRGVDVLYEKKGSSVNNYVYAGNLLIAKLSGTNTFYFHQDHLGSNRLVTLGQTTDFSSNYQPFGVQHGSSGTDPIYKYTGQEDNSAIGLYYYGARYYDSSTGRFISQDPLTLNSAFGTYTSRCTGSGTSAKGLMREPSRLNQYTYVINNPLTNIDPNGASACTAIFSTGCGAIGSLACLTTCTFFCATFAVTGLGALVCAVACAASCGTAWGALCGIIVPLLCSEDICAKGVGCGAACGAVCNGAAAGVPPPYGPLFAVLACPIACTYMCDNVCEAAPSPPPPSRPPLPPPPIGPGCYARFRPCPV